MIKLVFENTPIISVSRSEAFRREEGYPDIQEQSAEYGPPMQSSGLTPTRQQQNSGDQMPALDGAVETLCSQCQQIDFRELLDLAHSRTDASDIYRAKLNFSVHQDQTETCVLCAFVAEIAKDAYFHYPAPCTLRLCSVLEIEQASTVRRWIEDNKPGSSQAFHFRLLSEGAPESGLV